MWPSFKIMAQANNSGQDLKILVTVFIFLKKFSKYCSFHHKVSILSSYDSNYYTQVLIATSMAYKNSVKKYSFLNQAQTSTVFK